jgi:TolB-like protein/Tfp pilus assembly protein PilF
VAVLPFEDLSASGDQEYFAEGITEELLVRLSRVAGLEVIGRTSAFAFQGQALDVRAVADSLGVSVVLVGSVQQSGDRLRIFAQLVDGRSGFVLWSQTYERERADVFAIQDDIARAIVTQLRGGLAGEAAKTVGVAAAVDPDVYNLYLHGRFEWHKRTEDGLRNAARLLREAVDRAPTYARAWAGLGDAYAVLGFYDYLPPSEAFPAAADAANRALALDATLSEPHATLAYVALYHAWEWERAEEEFRRTLDLDPRYSTGHQWYANFLTAMGRFDEAVREMRAAQELDPLSLIANAALGWVLYYAGDYAEATDQLSRTLELNPDFQLAYLWRGLVRLEAGESAAAFADVERAVALSGGAAISKAALAYAHAVVGEKPRALELVRELEDRAGQGYAPSFEIAKIHEALGDRAAALRWLERAYEERAHSIAFLAVDPQLRGLRGEPAFERLLRRTGLQARTLSSN